MNVGGKGREGRTYNKDQRSKRKLEGLSLETTTRNPRWQWRIGSSNKLTVLGDFPSWSHCPQLTAPQRDSIRGRTPWLTSRCGQEEEGTSVTCFAKNMKGRWVSMEQWSTRISKTKAWICQPVLLNVLIIHCENNLAVSKTGRTCNGFPVLTFSSC